MEQGLGRKDSNLRMTGSKPAALPLGHAPQMISTMTIPYFDSSVNLFCPSWVYCTEAVGTKRETKSIFLIRRMKIPKNRIMLALIW